MPGPPRHMQAGLQGRAFLRESWAPAVLPFTTYCREPRGTSFTPFSAHKSLPRFKGKQHGPWFSAEAHSYYTVRGTPGALIDAGPLGRQSAALAFWGVWCLGANSCGAPLCPGLFSCRESVASCSSCESLLSLRHFPSSKICLTSSPPYSLSCGFIPFFLHFSGVLGGRDYMHVSPVHI